LRALNAEIDVAAAFPRVAAALCELTQCDRSNLIFFDRDYEEATLVALSEARADFGPGTRLRVRDIPAAANVVLGRAHFVPDLGAERQSPNVQSTYADGVRSLACLPLRGSEQVLGMLTLGWRKVGGTNTAQVPLLHQIADAVALATEKSRLFEEVRAGRERLEKLSHRLLEIQEAERQHIARELHDEIGQALTALKLSLDAVAAVSVDGAGSRLSDTRRQVAELLARVRNLALDLRPAMLDDLGLLPALLWLFERYTAQTGVQVNAEHRGLERRFSAQIETAAYRIVQEALTNVGRHAGVQQVTVRVWSDSGTLAVQIVDQGTGFDAEAALAAGMTCGLTGMRERAALLGGRLLLETAVGKGTRVSAELPVDDPGGDEVNA
jgi:signal transduction histidine kinase